MVEYVQLVNTEDENLGVMEKMEAHRSGLLHRAVSVFVMNSKNEMLLQRRALHKYHSAGLWSNACCTHPRPGEATPAAAHRRLMEEMGLNCNLQWVFNRIYRAALDNGLTEHEYDHIFTGYSDDIPAGDPEEVAEYMYLSLEEIDGLLAKKPDDFTVWFRLLYPEVRMHLKTA